MKTVIPVLVACLAASSVSAQGGWENVCGSAPANTFPFCNQTLAIEDRVADLVSRVTADALPGILQNGMSGISSLGIPAYQVWSEALHGVANSPGVTFKDPTPVATSFPQVGLSAASFNHTLYRTIGETIATELRAFANVGHAGLTVWTPNINIIRDPRWGRGQETPGEDPHLSGEYAREFVSGVQEGEDPRYLKGAPDLKHFDAYDLENYDGMDRHHFNAIVTAQDLADTYLPAFQAGVEEGRAASMMCSYNEVNGVPSCANDFLLTEIARNTWNFDGYITSDCGAVSDVINTHHYTSTSDATVKAVFDAGMDIDCGGYLKDNVAQALKDNAVSLTTIQKTALTNMWRVLFRLGMFDDPTDQPYKQITPDAVNTPEHQQRALDAARQGIVMLKNANNTLPLSTSSVKKIAVVGPNANATGTLQGNYFGQAPYLVTVVEGLSKYATVNYVEGCDIATNDTSGIPAAASAAAAADATVIVVGLDQSQEREGHDRNILSLPGAQSQLISAVSTASSGPVIVVVMAGGSVDLQAPRDSNAVAGMFWVGYPGQSGGQAIAETIFGDNVPAGRTIYTFYEAGYANEVSFFDMGMRPVPGTNPGRTYRFYQGDPVFPFGFGLSYTTFTYTWHDSSLGALRIPVQAAKDVIALRPQHGGAYIPRSPLLDPVSSVNVTVTNTGKLDADDSVLCFIVPPDAGGNGNPIQQLVGFERIHLAAGQSQNVFFPLTGRDITGINKDGQRVPLPGKHMIRIGVGENQIEIPLLVE